MLDYKIKRKTRVLRLVLLIVFLIALMILPFILYSECATVIVFDHDCHALVERVETTRH